MSKYNVLITIGVEDPPAFNYAMVLERVQSGHKTIPALNAKATLDLSIDADDAIAARHKADEMIRVLTNLLGDHDLPATVTVQKVTEPQKLAQGGIIGRDRIAEAVR